MELLKFPTCNATSPTFDISALLPTTTGLIPELLTRILFELPDFITTSFPSIFEADNELPKFLAATGLFEVPKLVEVVISISLPQYGKLLLLTFNTCPDVPIANFENRVP